MAASRRLPSLPEDTPSHDVLQTAVKIILCGTNVAGDVEGLARLRRAGDAAAVLNADGWLDKTLTTATRAR